MRTTTTLNIRRSARMLGACAVAALSGLAFTARGSDLPPERMTYQGFLVEEDSTTPLGFSNPENYDVVFSIFKEAVGGAPLWAEQQTVTVDKGYFSVLLGEGSDVRPGSSPALSRIFSGPDASDRYIDITVKGIGPGAPPTDVPILPRLKLVASPYAFMATHAGALTDGTGAGDIVTVSPGTGINVAGTIAATSATLSSSLAAATVNATTVNATNGKGIIPLGGIILWSGSIATIPSGWALCNGQTVSGLRTPNLQDRFVVGAGSGYSVDNSGGQASVTLTTSQMPSHSHTGYTDTDGAHSHTGQETHRADNDDNDTPGNYLGPGQGYPYYQTFSGVVSSSGSSHYHHFTTYNSGSGGSHENRPPYYALAYIMRVQ